MPQPEVSVERIVAGGQTGVDRAALDVAIARHLEHGGWCPQGRRAEDGPIPRRYTLRETDSPDYSVRTEANVVDSDATLIICRGEPTGGTQLTCQLARRHQRPFLIVDLDRDASDEQLVRGVQQWLQQTGIAILNVAGPRESSCPGIAETTRQFLNQVFDGEAPCG